MLDSLLTHNLSVFTQWVMVARILGRVLQEERIKFLYYFGEMSLTEKNSNIDMFKAPEKGVKVLVRSSPLPPALRPPHTTLLTHASGGIPKMRRPRPQPNLR
jgi:hypothetical protein